MAMAVTARATWGVAAVCGMGLTTLSLGAESSLKRRPGTRAGAERAGVPR
jgi:hypothetical protein